MNHHLDVHPDDTGRCSSRPWLGALLLTTVVALVGSTAGAPVAAVPDRSGTAAAATHSATTHSATSDTRTSARTKTKAKVKGHKGPWATLSNGCLVRQRGVADCGTYFGAGIGANTDPTARETEMGRRFGIHRVYWNASQVTSAMRSARTDLAVGRLPWMSFKLPYSWSEMAAGRGDAWVRDLADRLNTLPGPAWVAFHHEPEGDGNIADWTAMQARLGPIVRSRATNVGFSIILTGWDELYGDAQYRLGRIWPKNTKVDVAGFDVYNRYLVTSNGSTSTTAPDVRKRYFEPLAAWAEKKGVRWGLAETGISHPASERQPRWIEQAYRDVRATGGVAMAYFDSTLHSIARWDVSTATKKADFARALKLSPTVTFTK